MAHNHEQFVITSVLWLSFLTFLRCFINCDWYLLCDQHLIWWIFMVFYDFIFNIKNQFNQNKHLKVCCSVPAARSRNSNFELLRGRLSRWAAHHGDPSQGTTADNIDSTGFNCVGWAWIRETRRFDKLYLL